MIPLSRSSGVKVNPLFKSSYREETLEMIKTYPMPLTKQEIQLLPNFENKNASQNQKIKRSYQKYIIRENRFIAKLDREPIVEGIKMLLDEVKGSCKLNTTPILKLLRGGEKLFEVTIDSSLRALYRKVGGKTLKSISDYSTTGRLGEHLIEEFAKREIAFPKDQKFLKIRVYPYYTKQGRKNDFVSNKKFPNFKWFLWDTENGKDYAIKELGKFEKNRKIYSRLGVYRDDNHVIEFGEIGEDSGLNKAVGEAFGSTTLAGYLYENEGKQWKFSEIPKYRIAYLSDIAHRAEIIKMLQEATAFKANGEKATGDLLFYNEGDKKLGLSNDALTVIHELVHVLIHETECTEKTSKHSHAYIYALMRLFFLMSKLAADRNNDELKKMLRLLYYQLEIKKMVISKVYNRNKFGPVIMHQKPILEIEIKENWKGDLAEGKLPLDLKKELLDKFRPPEGFSKEIEGILQKDGELSEVEIKNIEKAFSLFEAEFETGDVEAITSRDDRITKTDIKGKTKHKEWNLRVGDPKENNGYTIRLSNGKLVVSKFTCTELLNIKECLENLGVFKCTTKTGK